MGVTFQNVDLRLPPHRHKPEFPFSSWIFVYLKLDSNMDNMINQSCKYNSSPPSMSASMVAGGRVECELSLNFEDCGTAGCSERGHGDQTPVNSLRITTWLDVRTHHEQRSRSSSPNQWLRDCGNLEASWC